MVANSSRITDSGTVLTDSVLRMVRAIDYRDVLRMYSQSSPPFYLARLCLSRPVAELTALALRTRWLASN